MLGPQNYGLITKKEENIAPHPYYKGPWLHPYHDS